VTVTVTVTVTDVAAAAICSAGVPACDGGVTMRFDPIARGTRALQDGALTNDNGKYYGGFPGSGSNEVDSHLCLLTSAGAINKNPMRKAHHLQRAPPGA